MQRSSSSTNMTKGTPNDKQLTPEVESKPKRQPKAKIHSRTPSYNKINALTRPGISRSKSTDGVIRVKRNNKSFTKLTNLQPLTKTLSNQSLKSNKSNTSLMNLAMYGHPGGLTLTQKQGKAILKLNDEDEEYEDLEEDEEVEVGIERGLDAVPQEIVDVALDVPLQQVFQQALGYEYGQEGQEERTGEGEMGEGYGDRNMVKNQDVQRVQGVPKEMQDLNGEVEDAQDISDQPLEVSKEEKEVESSISPQSSENEVPKVSESEGVIETQSAPTTPIVQPQTQIQPVQPVQPSQLQQPTESSRPAHTHQIHQNTSETDLTPSSNLYGASLFLSQSTGLVRKIDPNEMAYESVGDSSHDSGSISFKANPINLNQTVAKPVIVNKNVIKENSYQPNQTIFNNLQRTNSQYVNTKKQLQNQTQAQGQTQGQTSSSSSRSQLHNRNIPQDKINLNGANNFSNFLDNTKNSLSDSHDNRTQQRLWLQRENSLMDVTVDANQLANLSNLSLNNLMFSHNYPSSANLQSVSTTPGQSGPLGQGFGQGLGQGLAQGQIGPGSGQMGPGPGSGIGPLTPMDQIERTNSSTNMNGVLMSFQNGSQNPIQSRIEFERLNREYLNVRRYLNPIGESLNRFKTNTIKITKKNSVESNKNGNTFKEFSPEFQEKEQEVNDTLNKIWQDALFQTSSMKARQAQGQAQGFNSPQRPPIQRLQSRSQYMMRNSQAPTTRAVKLQAQQQAFRQ